MEGRILPSRVCMARPKKIPLYFIRNGSILFGHFSCGGSLGAEIISHSRLFFPPSPFYVSCKTLKRNPLEIVAQTIECMKHTRRIEMKSWNTAVGVRRTQGTTSSWLHPFSFFFFLHHLCFFFSICILFLRKQQMSFPGVIYSIASLSLSYLWTVVSIYLYLFLFCEFHFSGAMSNGRK